MTENVSRPLTVLGAIIGAGLSALFAWLFAALGGAQFSDSATVVVLILFVAWAVYCAAAFGGTPEVQDDEVH